MQVKCKNIYNEQEKEFKYKSPYLTINKEYIVFEILISFEKRILYRIACDNDGAPALFNAAQFDITSNSIPSTWKIYSLPNGGLILRLEPWAKENFWDEVFDQNRQALEIYKQEASKILNEGNIQ